MSETIYLDNKYHDWYYSIIANAQSQPRHKNNGIYYENHHIIPKSCGGSNEPNNLVLLTAREHYICHYLLTKFILGEFKCKMVFAFNLLSKRKLYFNSRLYESNRIIHSKLVAKNNTKHKSKPKEIRKYKCSHCGSEVIKEEFIHSESKKHYYCNAKCKNILIAKKKPKKVKQIKLVKKVKLKRIAWNKGKPMSEEQKKKLSQSRKGTPAWNKGIPNPTADENGKRGAKKLAETATGRRKKVLPDGSWTWEYPKNK